MFWDCMEYVEKHYASNDGFSLWLESDMCPTQADWIDRPLGHVVHRRTETSDDGLLRS